MTDRVGPNFSVKFELGGTDVLIDRSYDHAHVFPWLGHGILKVLTDEGLLEFHVKAGDAHTVCEQAGLTPIIREEITQREYDAYLRAQETQLEGWV